MRIIESNSDRVVLSILGYRVSQKRIDMGLTQEELAERTGVSKSTIERLESGKPSQLPTFIKVLRELQMLENLDLVLPEPKPSPIDIFKSQGKPRMRASARQRTQSKRTQNKRTGFVWGDES